MSHFERFRLRLSPKCTQGACGVPTVDPASLGKRDRLALAYAMRLCSDDPSAEGCLCVNLSDAKDYAVVVEGKKPETIFPDIAVLDRPGAETIKSVVLMEMGPIFDPSEWRDIAERVDSLVVCVPFTEARKITGRQIQTMISGAIQLNEWTICAGGDVKFLPARLADDA